jgi:polar amino acid transport system substrate-binding protein
MVTAYKTIKAGVLTVASAIPDPPFELIMNGTPAGFDIEWMQLVAKELGLSWRHVPYAGDDFNGIFEGLSNGLWDCVASGATITPEREDVATFCDPYVESGQSLVCNVEKTPQVQSIDDLSGLVLAVQHGNTSEPVAKKLKAAGRVADVRVYAYDAIEMMLNDLEAGRIGAVMKLAPVMHWFVRTRPSLRVVQERITDERLGIAVKHGNNALAAAINRTQAVLRGRGDLNRLKAKWLKG